MAEKLSWPDMLHRLKREQPFKPFEVVTRAGQRHPVKGRFHFAYNLDYLALLDHKNIPIHVEYDDIMSIDIEAEHVGSR